MNNQRDDKKLRRNTRFVVLGVLVFSAITITALVNKLSQPRILNEYELRDYGALLLDDPKPLLDFTLLDQDGEVFDRGRLSGKWTVIFFGFTNCRDICPTTMSLLAKTYVELKPEEKIDFEVVFVTVDPERDRPQVLKNYVSGFNTDFVGITGVQADLINFASQLQIPYFPALQTRQILDNSLEEQDGPQHSEKLILLNPRGELQGYFRPPFAHGALRVAWRSLRASFVD
jgi:protein SCO1/2